MKIFSVFAIFAVLIGAFGWLNRADAHEQVSRVDLDQTYTLLVDDKPTLGIVTALIQMPDMDHPDSFCSLNMNAEDGLQGTLRSDLASEFWVGTWDETEQSMAVNADVYTLAFDDQTDVYSFALDGRFNDGENTVILPMDSVLDVTFANSETFSVVTTTLVNLGKETRVCGFQISHDSMKLASNESFLLWGAAYNTPQILSALGPLDSRLIDEEYAFRLGTLPREDGINMFLVRLPVWSGPVAGNINLDSANDETSLINLVDISVTSDFDTPVSSAPIVSPAPISNDYSPMPTIEIEVNLFQDDFSLYIAAFIDLFHLDPNALLNVQLISELNTQLLSLVADVNASTSLNNNTTVSADVNLNNSSVVNADVNLNTSTVSTSVNLDVVDTNANVNVNFADVSANVDLSVSEIVDVSVDVNLADPNVVVQVGDIQIELNDIIDLPPLLPTPNPSAPAPCVLLIICP